MRDVMIDHHHHPAGLGWLFRGDGWTGLVEKLPQPGDLFDAEFVGVRMFEESPLCANREDELITSVRFYFSDSTNEIDCVRPA